MLFLKSPESWQHQHQSCLIKEQYHRGTVGGNGENQSDKSNTHNWGELCVSIKCVKPMIMCKRSRCILEGIYTYIILTGLSFLTPLILWASLYVDVIVVFFLNRCFIYLIANQQLQLQISQRNRNLFQKWRTKLAVMDVLKGGTIIHKNIFTIISGWCLGFVCLL